ncbi:WhiB family transcriptional regulator [Sciscionella marina]|uniref:WhiB family transcriptional regulator n=1 Tax=Sciscionella marina TaxID=508770 RepID=UPI0003809D5F|nr:WhiB family transcriptional regulator [Sciscionella marina]
MEHQDRLRQIADRLDRFAEVETDKLAEVVGTEGACMVAMTEPEPPVLTGEEVTDRNLAERLCSGCMFQEACLELELRWSGPVQVGVFGALPDEDRRDLYPIWRARRAQQWGGDR